MSDHLFDNSEHISLYLICKTFAYNPGSCHLVALTGNKIILMTIMFLLLSLTLYLQLCWVETKGTEGRRNKKNNENSQLYTDFPYVELFL